MRTGLQGTRLAALAYIVPFLFVFSPTLLMNGSLWEIVLSVATAVVGTWLVGMSLVGYLFRPLSWFSRAVLVLAGIGLLIPLRGSALEGLIPNVAGAALAFPFLLREWLRKTPGEYLPVSAAGDPKPGYGGKA